MTFYFEIISFLLFWCLVFLWNRGNNTMIVLFSFPCCYLDVLYVFKYIYPNSVSLQNFLKVLMVCDIQNKILEKSGNFVTHFIPEGTLKVIWEEWWTSRCLKEFDMWRQCSKGFLEKKTSVEHVWRWRGRGPKVLCRIPRTALGSFAKHEGWLGFGQAFQAVMQSEQRFRGENE